MTAAWVLAVLLLACSVGLIVLAASRTGGREGAGFWFSGAVTFPSLAMVFAFGGGSHDLLGRAGLAPALVWTVAGVAAAAGVVALVRGTIALRSRKKQGEREIQ